MKRAAAALLALVVCVFAVAQTVVINGAGNGALPTINSGTNGEYLTNNGSVASWGAVSGGGITPYLYAPAGQVATLNWASCPATTNVTLATFTIPASTLTVGGQVHIKEEFSVASTTNLNGGFPSPTVAFGSAGNVTYTNLANMTSVGNMFSAEADFSVFTSTSEVVNAHWFNGGGAETANGSAVGNGTENTASTITVTLGVNCGAASGMTGTMSAHFSLEAVK